MQWQIYVIHCFCVEVYSNLTPPDQWITSIIVPLPKKGDLSLMTNYRGISLLSIAAKVYNKILLNRIRDEVDPILRKNQAGLHPGRSCAQQIHILRRVLEGFRDYQLPLALAEPSSTHFTHFTHCHRQPISPISLTYRVASPLRGSVSLLRSSTSLMCSLWYCPWDFAAQGNWVSSSYLLLSPLLTSKSL